MNSISMTPHREILLVEPQWLTLLLDDPGMIIQVWIAVI